MNSTKWFGVIKAQVHNIPPGRTSVKISCYHTAGVGQPPLRVSRVPRATTIICYLLFLSTLYSSQDRSDGFAPWARRGDKPQTNVVPCVSVTFAGSSTAHRTTPGCPGPCATAFLEKSALSTQCSLQSSACSHRATLDCVLSSPENLEPSSLLSHRYF